MYTPAAHCDGAGACDNPTPVSCNGFACQGTQCASSCSASLPCPSASQYCDAGGKCRTKKSGGAGCELDGECGTGHCAEKVCCDTACGSTCSSCLANNTGSADGQCAPVKVGLDPYNQCSATPATGCLEDGACNGAGACRRWVAGTPCRTASCANNSGGSTETPAGACNGSGLCQDQGGGGGCGAYLCGGSQCLKSCTSTSQCYGNRYCNGSNQCMACPQPSASNLLVNPGFNQDLGSWIRTLDQWALDNGGDIFRNNLDRNACASSGSMQMSFGNQTNVIAHQCVTSGEGTYDFGGAFLASHVPEAVMKGGVPWNGTCSLRFYGSMTDCMARNGQLAQKSLALHDVATEAGKWIKFGVSWFAPVGTKSVMFECDMVDDGAVKVYVLLDQLYLSQTGSEF
jgi:hypothetical protein